MAVKSGRTSEEQRRFDGCPSFLLRQPYTDCYKWIDEGLKKEQTKLIQNLYSF